MLALYTPDATWEAVPPGPGGSFDPLYERDLVTAYATLDAWEMALGRTMPDPVCTVEDEVENVSVTYRCEFESHNAVARAAGVTMPVSAEFVVTPLGIASGSLSRSTSARVTKPIVMRALISPSA